jgi:DNA-binding transcriptional regulator LsrR (DeoR family)
LDKLKVLLVLLLAAVLGLAVSLFLLALAFLPTTSLEGLFYRIVTEGFPPGLPFVIPLSTLLFLSTVLASVVGVIYFLVLPEMKDYYSSGSAPVGRDASAMVMRTLKPDERKVVGVIKVHGGNYIQKFITQEAGLSRLKTHRVVAALAERGIVRVEKRGNSNEVTLAEWFLEGMEK